MHSVEKINPHGGLRLSVRAVRCAGELYFTTGRGPTLTMSMRKEVISRTIAGVFSGLILLALGWMFGVLPWMWAKLGELRVWLGGDVVLYRWWYYVLLLVFVGVLLLSGVMAVVNWFAARDVPDPNADFTELRLNGVVWRWRWNDGAPSQLMPYCPRCDRAVTLLSNDYSRFDDQRIVHCQQCGNIGELYGTQRQIERQVQIEIDHTIRKRNERL
jgi:hypothetical protein